MQPTSTCKEILAQAEGCVLAGGASSRFGVDKSLALLAGQPLVAHALQQIRATGIPASIAGAASSTLASFAPVYPDIHPGKGPLSGLHAALEASTAEWLLFLPVDMPLMPSLLLQSMLHRAILTQAQVTCWRLQGRLQPLPVLLHRSLAPRIQKALAAGMGCAQLWRSLSEVDAPAVEELLQCAQLPMHSIPTQLWWQSANTPADLAAIQALFPVPAPAIFPASFSMRNKSRTLEA